MRAEARRALLAPRKVADTLRAGPPAARVAAWAAGGVGTWLVLDNVLPRGMPLGIVVLGLVFGSLYAIVAVGVVLIYKANRVVNFAQAEFGAIAAVLTIQLFRVWQWSYIVSLAVGVLAAAVLGGALSTIVVRRFGNAPRLILAVATIGVAQVLNGATLIVQNLFGSRGATGGLASALRNQARPFSAPLHLSFSIRPVIFNQNHLVAIVVAVAAMAALAAFLRFTDYGVAIRAAAANNDRANLLGIPVARLSIVVWSIAALLSALAVIVRVPILGFTNFQSVTGGGNALLIRTLAAAVIGRMDSLPRTVAAAMGLAVFQETASWTWANTDFVDAALVLVILAALFMQREYFFSRQATIADTSAWRAIREVRPVPRELRPLPEVRYPFGALRIALLAGALLLPVFTTPSQEQAIALIFVYAMVALSLFVLTGWSGQISLGQWAIVGFGGATVSTLYWRHGWDFLLATLAGVLVASLVALVIGLPALRIRGPFLAVTTLAFAVTAFSFLLEDRYFPWFITARIERPVLWGRFPLDRDWQVYYFCLAALLLVMAGVRNLRRSRTGRAIIATRDNEAAVELTTADTVRLKLTAFVVAGAVAGLAGAAYILHQRGLYTGSFGSEVSVRLFSMVVIGGLGSMPGSLLGAAYVRTAESFLPRQYALITSGAGILLLLMFLPEGLGGLLYRVRDAYLRTVARRRRILVPSLVADARDLDVVVSAKDRGLEFLRQVADTIDASKRSGVPAVPPGEAGGPEQSDGRASAPAPARGRTR